MNLIIILIDLQTNTLNMRQVGINLILDIGKTTVVVIGTGLITLIKSTGKILVSCGAQIVKLWTTKYG
jgi:hypothetical protein